MMPMIVLVLAACGLALGSGVGHFQSLATVGAAPVPVAPAPVVAAHSSQYFERTFNRLLAAPLVPEPVFPVHPVAPVAHVHPVAPPPPQVFVESITRTVPVSVNPTQNVPADPNVAIAIATAHAAAPVATIVLPPYPFAPPPTFGFVPQVPQVFVPQQRNETVTQPTTEPATTVKEPEQTTPFPQQPQRPLRPQQPQQPQPSNFDNNFAQAPTSNQNTNFQVQQVYGPPLNVQPLPKPQKLQTSVEVVPVPLRYIAPPPVPHHHHHHHHHHGHHAIKYVHSFVPAKLIVRPVHVHTVKVPARLVLHTHRVPIRKPGRSQQNVLRSRIDNARDIEPTTFKPFRPITKPPKI